MVGCFFVCLIFHCWDFSTWRISQLSRFCGLVSCREDLLYIAWLEIQETSQVFSGTCPLWACACNLLFEKGCWLLFKSSSWCLSAILLPPGAVVNHSPGVPPSVCLWYCRLQCTTDVCSQGCPTRHPFLSVLGYKQDKSLRQHLPKSQLMLNSFPPAGRWELGVSSRTVHHVQAWVVGVVMRRESGECHEFPVKLPCGWLSISLVCRNLLTSFWISHRGILSLCCVKSVSMEERESRASYSAILLISLPVSLYSFFLGIHRSPLLMYICVLSNLWHKHIKPQRMALKYIFMYFCQLIFRIYS